MEARRSALRRRRWAVAAGINRLTAPGLSRGNDEIDRATAALRADKASGPISDGKIGAVPRRLFAGIDIDVAPAAVAPGAQQQIRLGRRAERRRPRRAFEALPPHGVPIPPAPCARARAAPAHLTRGS